MSASKSGIDRKPAPTETELLQKIALEIGGSYAQNERLLSFGDYFHKVLQAPQKHVRSSAQYLKDVFDHFGTETVWTPKGERLRYRLFDVPFEEGRDRLVGHEEVQGKLYRALENFVREGAVNKLVLLYGPNGSAKSTLVACIQRALEHYSTQEEGTLYRFHWIFPVQKLTRGGIGFGGGEGEPFGRDSFAYLDEEMVEARISDELKDHPLLLLPVKWRQELLERLFAETGFVVSDYLKFGDLSPKNKQIYETLLLSYRGDYFKVLRHVQVERLYISRRYRNSAVTIEPQLAVDARTRQITMDRSLSALPAVLQSLSLHEFSGELVDANRGVLEFADLLKRPLEAYKYLLGTIEHAKVAVDHAMIFIDAVLLGSTNDAHLNAFREIPEFQSFRGRMEFVRVPYLLNYRDEQKIYADSLAAERVGRHQAPHAIFVAALWSVLTRMRKPLPEKYGKSMADLVGRLLPLHKADLYAGGQVPEEFTPEEAKQLLAHLSDLYGESDAYPNYEGRTGASPREMKTLLLHASQSQDFTCLSPFAVLEELEDLVRAGTTYEFLKQEPLPGGYHENRRFISVVRERLMDQIDEEVRTALGLVEERQVEDLFEKYIVHVSNWTKNEKVIHPITGRLEDADQELMGEVERALEVAPEKREEARRELISRIGAWSIEHPRQKINYAKVFSRQLQKMKDAYFFERKKQLAKTAQELLMFFEDRDTRKNRLLPEAYERARAAETILIERFGYCSECAKDAVLFVHQERYNS